MSGYRASRDWSPGGRFDPDHFHRLCPAL